MSTFKLKALKIPETCLVPVIPPFGSNGRLFCRKGHVRCWKKVLVCLFLYLFIQVLMVKTWQEVRTERDGESGTTWNKNPWLDSKPERMKHIYNHFLHNEPWLQLLLLGIMGSINILPSHVFTCMYFKYAAVRHSLSSLAHTLRGGVGNRGNRCHL